MPRRASSIAEHSYVKLYGPNTYTLVLTRDSNR